MCGHVKTGELNVPKYGSVRPPFEEWERRARCTECNTRGACDITMKKQIK
ncbi:hypothetical protein [Nevskia ramosa]|nr:hypothetical protein [Nevskia ramosa]